LIGSAAIAVIDKPSATPATNAFSLKFIAVSVVDFIAVRGRAPDWRRTDRRAIVGWQLNNSKRFM
jgi:hypothetical protein